MSSVPGGMGSLMTGRVADIGYLCHKGGRVKSTQAASLGGIDRDLIAARVRSMAGVEAPVVARERFNLVLFAAFGGVGLVLATVGLYGVTVYLVAQRTREIAIRMALGGQRGGVMGLVLREAMTMTLAGLVVGLAAAAFGSRLLASLLFGVGATDPWTYGAIAVLLVIIAVAAALVPGIRATHINPIVAMRA